MMGFIRELRKRHVVKVGIAYLIAAWVVLQLADVIFPALGLPEWSITWALGLLAVGFPVALVLAWVFDITQDGIKRTINGAEKMSEPLDSAPPDIDQSIAVLPFPDMSAEQDQEHFCDGLTEELLNVLTRIPNLRVASRTSCFAFKGKNADLPSVAGKLHVAHILEGSVRKSGNRIRVTAQLIEAATDSHLWSETYDRELDDIFAIQDDIAARILEVLSLKLGAGSLPEPTTRSAKAYEYFLRGRGYAMTNGEQDNERAIELFQKATAADPEFLRAWTDLAEACAMKSLFMAGGETARMAAMEASEKAMLLAPDSAISHLARGYAHMASNQFAEAEQDFFKVIELDPKKFDAYHHLARAAQHHGNTARAMEYFNIATELNPDNYESPLIAIGSYQQVGDQEGMRKYARIGIERARRHLEDYPDNPRPYYLGTSAFLILDDPDSAKKWAEAALAIAPEDSTTRYNLACYYALIGEPDRSLDLLENSIQSRSWIKNDPELESLHDLPRFKALLESLPG